MASSPSVQVADTKLRAKITDKQFPLPENWDRCHAFLPKKMKYCRQLPVFPAKNDAAMYCGNHFCLLQSMEADTASSKRVPCPLDPTHTVLERLLATHLKKCPAAKQARRQEESYYFAQNINTGGSGTLHRQSSKGSLEWAQQVALRVLQVHQQIFAIDAATTQTQAIDAVDPTLVTLADICAAIPTIDLSLHEYESGLNRSLQEYHVRSGGPKHVHQQASLVGHLRQCGAFDRDERHKQHVSTRSGSKTTILEVGAGRGMTGLVVAGVAAALAKEATASSSLPRVKLVMVERNGSRSKADTILRKASMLNVSDKSYMDLDMVDYSRIHCDLSHVNIDKVLEKEHSLDGKLIVVAKHLCGVGTDLALKSMEPIKDQVSACIMATCCHGACRWSDYVGRDFLCADMDDPSRNFVFGSAEFDLLCHWSGGAVHVDNSEISTSCTADRPDVNNDYPNIATNGESVVLGVTRIVESLNLRCGQQGLGRACQRLIDYGRLGYIRDVLYPKMHDRAKLLYYVSCDISPQNAALVIRTSDRSPH
ncbi:hypothetical protein MPSEU_000574900 [Mayamaea pseudoterrestris]|nr:hypothetical protein MPSEU_000574900 [Mayamaea pseudoterrestris]